MRQHPPSVSIHDFKNPPGKMDRCEALLPQFVAKTNESGRLYYEFTVSGDVIFCREGYVGAAGALAHNRERPGDPARRDAQDFRCSPRLENPWPRRGTRENSRNHSPPTIPSGLAYECGI